MLLNSLLARAIAEKWSAERLAKEGNCSIPTAKKFLNTKAAAVSDKTDRQLELSGGRMWTVLTRAAKVQADDLDSLLSIREKGGVLTKDQEKQLSVALSRIRLISGILKPSKGEDITEKPANAKLSLR
jgi:hypothetical protein